MKIIDKTEELARIISPRVDRNKPIYRWHSFKHSYSKELVDRFIDEFKISNKSIVLDPFVGGGTTLLACKNQNIDSVGIDISPFSVFLSKTKTNNYNIEKLENSLKTIENQLEKNLADKFYSMPDIPLIKKAFQKDVWNEINEIKEVINKIDLEKNKNFFLLALLSILEAVSNTSKAGGFLRITKRNIKNGKAKKIFLEYSQSMINDLLNSTISQNGTKIKVQIGDARKLNSIKKFDAIITSPPYPNRHDYTRIYALELILHFIKNNQELKKLRYKTLRSHVEARERFDSNGYKRPSKLINLIKRIEANGTNNYQIINMLNGYFEDMYLCLKEMKKALKRNGKVALVISNVRFSGINIPVDEILGELGERVGLKLIEIRIARYRGNSSQQMRDYMKNKSRESIIIWKN
jgi:tRNA G10  N-methylase Trm11